MNKNDLTAPRRIYISGLDIENFKSFKNEKINFAPNINLIFGKNSAGKSSIFQALRIIKQSFLKDNLIPLNLNIGSSNTENHYNNGFLDLDLSFKELIFQNEEKKKLGFGIETNIYDQEKNEILNQNQKIKYIFKNNKNFFKQKNLINEKIVLDGIKISTPNLNLEIETAKHKFLNSGSVEYNFYEGLISKPLFSSIRFTKKSTGQIKYRDKYVNIYKPFFFEIKVKKIENIKINAINKFFDEKNLQKNDAKKTLIKILNKILSYKVPKKFPFANLSFEYGKVMRELGRVQGFNSIKSETKLLSIEKDKLFQIEKIKNLEKFILFSLTVPYKWEKKGKKIIQLLKLKVKSLIRILKKSKNIKNDLIRDLCYEINKKGIYYKGNFLPKFDRYYLENIVSFAHYDQDLNENLFSFYDFLSIIFFGNALNLFSFNDDKYLPRRGLPERPILQLEPLYVSLRKCMNKTYILPGLRALPTKYFVKGLQTSYVGARAENIAELLSNPVFKNNVNEWLKKLEIPYSVDVRKSGNYYEIVFLDRKKRFAITQTHVGLGYPMILPFILQALISRNQIIIVEEPEVHLHPKLEADLANLIVYSSTSRENQFFIETHSEDFLLRILKLIRLKKINAENVAINYISNDKKNNDGSKAELIKINKQGSYSTSWKDGLFADRYKDLTDSEIVL